MENIHPTFEKLFNREQKERVLNQKAKVIWFTGLSGSGKTTLSIGLEKELFKRGYFCQVLDGDNIRAGINNNLGFSEEDRLENIRRISEVSKLFLDSGIVTICAFISPTNEIRNIARNIIGEDNFIEIFVNTPIEICESRDSKGLYKKAREGKIKNFTGISSPFELPFNPYLCIDTSKKELQTTIEELYNVIESLIKPK